MASQPKPAPRPLTPEEYLAQERASEFRSEYVAGEIFAMSGASPAHNTIALNVAAELRAQLRGRRCSVFISDIRVKTSKRAYRYPDVVALCGEPRFDDAQRDTLLNPSLIVEVLAESTEKADRGEKFFEYRRLESLRECVLVSQHRPLVERYERQGDLWVLSDFTELDERVELPSLGCVLTLGDIYERVDFAAAPAGDAGEEDEAVPSPS
jgi:Uma2 family endonuclease